MTPLNAKTRVAVIMALNTWEHRRSAKRMPLLNENAKEAERANQEAVTELGMLALYQAELSILESTLEGHANHWNSGPIQISMVDPHTRVISALIEMIQPMASLAVAGVAAEIVTTGSGAKFLDAISDLRQQRETKLEDGRTWWPIVNTHSLHLALEWLSSLGPDPWGRRLQQADMRWSVLPGGPR